MSEHQPEETIKGGNARILIVDDEEIVRGLADEMLTSLGFTVTCCCDGQQAIDLYKTDWEQFDLIILDVIMPNVSGRDAFLAMRQINPEIKALLSSGYGLNNDIEEILEQGAKGFLQKPFRMTTLSQKVSDVLNS